MSRSSCAWLHEVLGLLAVVIGSRSGLLDTPTMRYPARPAKARRSRSWRPQGSSSVLALQEDGDLSKLMNPLGNRALKRRKYARSELRSCLAEVLPRSRYQA